MEVQISEEERIERDKVLKLIGKVILMTVSLGAILIGSLILSGEIGAATYRILGIPANFHLVWHGWRIGFTSYLSHLGGEQFLVPVILSRGLGTLAIFIGLWYLIHSLRWSWKLIFEPWLLIIAPFQLFLALFAICDLHGLNILMGICLLLGAVGVPIFVFFRYHYYEKIKNWL